MLTLVIGASEHPERYSNKAILMLQKFGHEVLALASRKGSIGNLEFYTEKPAFKQVDTVTLYINPRIQKEYYDYILRLHPRRVIFNPGTENPEFYTLLKEKGIEVQEACTLVLLSTKQF
ncbi:MAG: CoA-binding protein [Chitinophagales bacterium]